MKCYLDSELLTRGKLSDFYQKKSILKEIDINKDQ